MTLSIGMLGIGRTLPCFLASIVACLVPMDLVAFGDAVIPFKITPTRTLNLHHYRPVDWQASERRPVIVFWHGGGWHSPNIGQFTPHAEYYRNRGLVAILAEYRVVNLDATKVESAILDARSAMRHLKANAASYGIDPTRIVAAGGSAGGHLALGCSMFSGYPPELTDPPNVDPAPAATITFNPVVKTTLPDGYGNTFFASDPQNGSPINHVRPLLPPCLIMNGTNDGLAFYHLAQTFTQAMTNAGNDCELVAYTGLDHGFFNNEPYLSQTISQTDAFLESRGIIGSLAQTGFERWRHTAFGVSGNIGTGADMLDPDHDGLVNVLDYALGGQAMKNDSAIAVMTPRLIGNTLKLTFGHRPDPHLRISLLHSSDMVNWTSTGEWNGAAWSGGATFKTSLEGERLLIEARLPVQPAVSPEFWRLGVRHAPASP